MHEPFGKTTDGRPIDRYTLKNANGLEADVITWGGIVTRLLVPDRSGKPGDVVLGFDTLDGYLKQHPYFGAIVGRYGNRIAKGRFSLNGKSYTLTFKAKADAARSIQVQAGQDEEPWGNLGLDEPLDLTTDWKDQTFTFTANDVKPNKKNRVGFVLGAATGKVYVKDVVLKAK